MGSSSGTNTVQEKSEPWERAEPFLAGQNISLLNQARGIYRQSRRNRFDPVERLAMGMMRDRADRDYSLVDAGAETLGRTARGDFLGSENFMDAYGEGILNDVNTRFGMANRTGSGYAAQAAAKGLAQGAAPLYAQERAMQQQAALASPQFQAGQYGLLDSDINALLQLGSMRRMRPYENLQNYANILLPTAGQGGTTQTQQPYYTNPAAGALGGAATGATFGPWGAAIGGALGYLGSR